MKPDPEAAYRQMLYVPDQDPAIAAAVLFFVTSIVNLYFTHRTKTRWMVWAGISGLLECAGYICRIFMLYRPTYMLNIFMMCLLIITPILLALVVYCCVGELLVRGNPAALPSYLKPLWVARVFLASDILCIVIQGGGASLLTDPTKVDLFLKGERVLLGGLGLQLAFFTCFFGLTLFTHLNKTLGVQRLLGGASRPVFFCIYSTIFLLYVRNIFRVAEFVTGFDGKLATNEKYLYGLDFAPIYTTVLLYTIFHFGFYLRDTAVLPITADGTPAGSSTDKAAKAPSKAPSEGAVPVVVARDAELDDSARPGWNTVERTSGSGNGGRGSRASSAAGNGPGRP